MPSHRRKGLFGSGKLPILQCGVFRRYGSCACGPFGAAYRSPAAVVRDPFRLSEFFTGKGESPFNLMPEEIVTEIRVPIPWGPTLWSYQRLSFRSAVDFPYINSAATCIIEKGKIESFRAVLSAAGPAPITLKEIEKAVKGQQPEFEMAKASRQNSLESSRRRYSRQCHGIKRLPHQNGRSRGTTCRDRGAWIIGNEKAGIKFNG